MKVNPDNTLDWDSMDDTVRTLAFVNIAMELSVCYKKYGQSGMTYRIEQYCRDGYFPTVVSKSQVTIHIPTELRHLIKNAMLPL